MILGAAQGQPGWLHPWFSFWVNLQDPHAGFFAYFAAVIETLIALALIAGFARKLTYISAAVFSLLIWFASITTTARPLRASTSAMPAPMMPKPTTATSRISEDAAA
jgi:uncharacterized membrane protein YphA (DoxX/SURF4 family)